MVKYMGGGFSCDTACAPCCALADLLLGDLDCFAAGYGNGVFSSGWWVYEARYRRSLTWRIVMSETGCPETSLKEDCSEARPVVTGAAMLLVFLGSGSPAMYSITCP
jgi:hypothetical protein